MQSGSNTEMGWNHLWKRCRPVILIGLVSAFIGVSALSSSAQANTAKSAAPHAHSAARKPTYGPPLPPNWVKLGTMKLRSRIKALEDGKRFANGDLRVQIGRYRGIPIETVGHLDDHDVKVNNCHRDKLDYSRGSCYAEWYVESDDWRHDYLGHAVLQWHMVLDKDYLWILELEHEPDWRVVKDPQLQG